MMMLLTAAIAAFHLIQLHGPGGTQIDVNPHEISSLRDPSVVPEGHFAKGIKCLLFMTNGKVVAVTEDCDTVKIFVEEAQ
jgi:hypothetical protein